MLNVSKTLTFRIKHNENKIKREKSAKKVWERILDGRDPNIINIFKIVQQDLVSKEKIRPLGGVSR